MIFDHNGAQSWFFVCIERKSPQGLQNKALLRHPPDQAANQRVKRL